MSLLDPMDDEQLDAIIQGLERIKSLEAEVARLRLNDAEREAVERSAAAWEADSRMGLSDGGVAATLRGLLERMKLSESDSWPHACAHARSTAANEGGGTHERYE